MTKPIIGELSIETDDGTTLTAGTDIALARKWAQHEIEVLAKDNPTDRRTWDQLTTSEQNIEIADALTALQIAFTRSNPTD